MINIKMINGDVITIQKDTVLKGFNNLLQDEQNPIYYLADSPETNWQGDFDEKGSPIATVDPCVGITGFILSHDSFKVDNRDEHFLTSAVHSISTTDH